MADYPALPLWTDAYLSDTPPVSAATWTHHGIYLLLLFKAWRTPGQRLPNDSNWLALHMGCTMAEVETHVRPVLEIYFKCDGNFWKQKRLSKEASYLKKQSRAQSARAKSRENNKKQQHPNDNPAPPNQQSGGAPTPTPTPTPLLSKKEALPPSIAIPNGIAHPPTPKPTSRKTPLKGEFVIEINSERYAYATQCGMTEAIMAIECDKFENHHRAKGNLMADWDAAWRTWCRNWQTYSQQRTKA